MATSNALKRMVSEKSRWLRTFLMKIYRLSSSSRPCSPIEQYLASGRRPWTIGYDEYRQEVVSQVLSDRTVMNAFRLGQPLPKGYGYRLDERIIEYPWVLSRLANDQSLLIDGGGALDFPYVLDQEILSRRQIVIYTLVPSGQILKRPNVSYVFGDLRNTILKSGLAQYVVCISTLEHIGMDNTLLYTRDAEYSENNPNDYQYTLREFYGLLRPHGNLLLTIPYGKYQNLGWLQQFDDSLINSVISTFEGRLVELAFYRYLPDGWVLATGEECRNCYYYDVHSAESYDADFAAAARAVACIQLQKS